MKRLSMFVVATLLALSTTMAFAGQAMPAASGKTMEEQNAGSMGTKMEDSKMQNTKMEDKMMQGDSMKMEEKTGAMGTKMEGAKMEDKKMDEGAMKMEGKK